MNYMWKQVRNAEYFFRRPIVFEKNKFEDVSCACTRPVLILNMFEVYFLENEALNGQILFPNFLPIFNKVLLIVYLHIANTHTLDKLSQMIFSKTKSYVKKFYSISFSTCSFTPYAAVPLVLPHPIYIKLSQKFLSFYKKIIDVQHLLFHIILLNYVWSILF